MKKEGKTEKKKEKTRRVTFRVSPFRESSGKKGRRRFASSRRVSSNSRSSHESSRLHRTRLLPGSSFLVFLLSPISDPPTKMEGKRAPSPAVSLGRSAPTIPRNNTKISAALFPPAFSPFSGGETERGRQKQRGAPLHHTAYIRTRRVYTRSSVPWPSGTTTHRRSYLLFLAFSFLPAGTLIYSAHKRCSQITVPFMTLLLHRRTRSFLR